MKVRGIVIRRLENIYLVIFLIEEWWVVWSKPELSSAWPKFAGSV
jgi:hypothetical protein